MAILAREDERGRAALARMRDVRTLLQEQPHRRLVSYPNFQVRMRSCRSRKYRCTECTDATLPFRKIYRVIQHPSGPGNARTGQLLPPLVAILAREDQRGGSALACMLDVRTLGQEQSHRPLVAYSGVQVRMQSCRSNGG